MNKLIKFIIAFAFFIQALIPAGFMPDARAGSGTAIIICSGLESKTIYIDDQGQPVSSHEENTAKSFCPYTALAGGKLLTTPPQSIITALQTIIETEIVAPQIITRYNQDLRPPAIGPPVLL